MASRLTLEYFGEYGGVCYLTARCPGPVAAKQTQIISPSPPCLVVDMSCADMTGFGFLQRWHCA